MSILVVGNAVVDIAYHVPRLPRPGETLLASARRTDVGGKGLNQAVAARRAGSQVRLVAPVGGDEAAQRSASTTSSCAKASTPLSWWRLTRQRTRR